jgi:hypothetical protein
MPRSICTSKTAVLDFDISELRQILTERVGQALGGVEAGFERKFDIEPIFNVLHGQACLHAIRVRMEDVRTASLPGNMFFSAPRDEQGAARASEETLIKQAPTLSGASKH